MTRKHFLIIGLILGLIFGYIIWSNFLTTGPSTSRLATDFQLTATELYQAFETDEPKANQKYLNKILEVEGSIVDVMSSDDLKPSISLKTDGFGVVKCSFESTEALEDVNIKNGSNIKIKGECIGYLLDVLITNSIIINN